MNFPQQMEPFDTNIIYFIDLNRCQRHFSLFLTGIRRHLFPLSTKNKKITKINFEMFTKFDFCILIFLFEMFNYLNLLMSIIKKIFLKILF
jgi:hypothetical protein